MYIQVENRRVNMANVLHIREDDKQGDYACCGLTMTDGSFIIVSGITATYILNKYKAVKIVKCKTCSSPIVENQVCDVCLQSRTKERRHREGDIVHA